jgi:hypothetical protein
MAYNVPSYTITTIHVIKIASVWTILSRFTVPINRTINRDKIAWIGDCFVLQ